MIKIMAFWALLAFFTVMTVLSLHADTVYTTGLNLKKSGTNIILEWKANVSKGVFNIYRSPSFPIGNTLSLSNSLKLLTVQMEGKPFKELYMFSSVTDTVTRDGKYYYLVLPERNNIKDDDFSPNLNYNISPVMYKSEEPLAQIDESGPQIIEELEEIEAEKTVPQAKGDRMTVKSIFIKTNLGVFQVFWDLDDLSGSHRFSLYRTTNRIISTFDLQKVKPVRELVNEYFYEDTEVKYGVPYYYTIIVNDYKMILVGENQNQQPVFWGNTNSAEIRVERDVYRRVKVNSKSFNSRFKK